MNRWVRIPEFLFILAFAILLLVFPQVTVRTVSGGLSVCACSILPSLFPFFVLTNLWISLGYANALSRAVAPAVQAVFHLPGPAASAILLGALGGYPVGAQAAAQLYRDHLISREDAQQVLLFCNNAGPAFIFGILGSGLFQSTAAGAILWAIHLGSALLLGILFRPRKRPSADPAPVFVSETKPFLPALTAAVTQAGETAFRVCLFVLFFSVAVGFLQFLVPDSWQASSWFTLFLGSLELAGGAKLLTAASLSPATAFVAASGLLGWGGLCVHCQTLSTLSEAGLSVKSYLGGKLLHGLVSASAACLLLPTVPIHTACFSSASSWHPSLTFLPLLLLLFAALPKSSSGKPPKKRV